MKKKSTTRRVSDLKGKNKTKDLKNQLARALADYDNLNKRFERQTQEVQLLAGAKLVNRLLPVLDMLDRARDYSSDSGLAIIASEFREVLKDEGLIEIVPEEGDVFDEEIFEAVKSTKTKDTESQGLVSGVELSGWKYKDGPVLRHAKVSVFKITN